MNQTLKAFGWDKPFQGYRKLCSVPQGWRCAPTLGNTTEFFVTLKGFVPVERFQRSLFVSTYPRVDATLGCQLANAFGVL
ncbi:MAG TPA: hypothetical protein VLB68_14205, partial [Pyrinomonadaceae bacterium]|nr:hypothetical protein [Pyrinomonadaceae bacterium]